MSVIAAHALRKRFDNVHALDGFDLQVGPGQIVGLIGPNGCGKTTALNSLLGLTALDSGDLTVLGRDPFRQRAALMQQVAYIADTGILPRWMKVSDLLRYVADVHVNFDLDKAQAILANTEIDVTKRVRVLSKGMHVQLHLAIVLAIDAQMLVLDEPTLGLDILHRQQFYDAVLSDYAHTSRSILVTTHEVREIEHILTDVVFMHAGRAILAMAVADIANTYYKLTTEQSRDVPGVVLSHKPTPSGFEYVLSNVEDPGGLVDYGVPSVPNLAELFVALVERQSA